jgi:hypothetical protein
MIRNNMNRSIVAALAGVASVAFVAQADAKVARHVAQPVQQDVVAPAQAATPASASEEAPQFCEVSRMQVPAAGGSLIWKKVVDCDAD